MTQNQTCRGCNRNITTGGISLYHHGIGVQDLIFGNIFHFHLVFGNTVDSPPQESASRRNQHGELRLEYEKCTCFTSILHGATVIHGVDYSMMHFLAEGNLVYAKLSGATTLQSCFLDCKREAGCKNVFVDMKALPKWLEKPGPIICTLLGEVASIKAACPKTGTGTLVKMLDARPRPRLV